MSPPSTASGGADHAGLLLALKATAVTGVLLTVFALLGWSLRAGYSTAFGAVAAWLNLWGLSRVVRALLVVDEDPPDASNVAAPPESGSSRGAGKVAWGAFAFLKIVLLFGCLYLLLDRKVADPMALAAGYGALPLGIVTASLISAMRPQRP